MSTILKRTIAVVAALMMVGAIAGCERRMDQGQQEDQEGAGAGQQQEEGAQMGQDQEQQPPTAAEQMGEEADQQAQQAEQKAQEGMAGQEQQMQAVRESVGTALGIPASAVTFGPEIRESIMQAQDDFQREAWGTVGTVETYLTRIQMDELDQQERQAATELQTSVSQVQQDLQKMQQASGQQAQMKSQIEQDLEKIQTNWKQISDKVQMEQQPAGGGPVQEGQQPEPRDQQQPSGQESY